MEVPVIVSLLVAMGCTAQPSLVCWGLLGDDESGGVGMRASPEVSLRSAGFCPTMAALPAMPGVACPGGDEKLLDEESGGDTG